MVGRPPLDDRTALVTGAAAGLGAALVRQFRDAGAHVVGVDVVEVDGVSATGRDANVRWCVADVSRPTGARQAVQLVEASFPALDIVVNNAGLARWSSLDLDLTVADATLTEVLDANLRSAFLVTRAAVPALRRTGGDVVNVSTDHVFNCGSPVPIEHDPSSACPWARRARGFGAQRGMDAYDAAKWALNGLTGSWARHLAPDGVRVNGLCVGATDTPMLRAAVGGELPDDMLVLSADEVATVVVDLIAGGDRTGQNVGVWPGHEVSLPPPHSDRSRPT